MHAYGHIGASISTDDWPPTMLQTLAWPLAACLKLLPFAPHTPALLRACTVAVLALGKCSLHELHELTILPVLTHTSSNARLVSWDSCRAMPGLTAKSEETYNKVYGASLNGKGHARNSLPATCVGYMVRRSCVQLMADRPVTRQGMPTKKARPKDDFGSHPQAVQIAPPKALPSLRVLTTLPGMPRRIGVEFRGILNHVDTSNGGFGGSREQPAFL